MLWTFKDLLLGAFFVFFGFGMFCTIMLLGAMVFETRAQNAEMYDFCQRHAFTAAEAAQCMR